MLRIFTQLTALLAVLMIQGPLWAEDALPIRASNGLALTPPMGWNTWNKFQCNINEQLIRNMADAMVTSGMKAAGYQYVLIDDCWQGARDAHGDIQPDPKRFPSGMKALGDYVHGRGLKFGVYSDAGVMTCAKRAGSQGHEYQDAAQYAAWGVDYLKYDWCYTGKRNAQEAYGVMADALRATGRPIVFSMCEWGTAKPWLWARNTGNLWRTTEDIRDNWDGKERWMHGVIDIVDMNVGLAKYAGPGGWNDPDMLEIGNGGMNDNEYRAQFSFWAMLAAPLIAGNDLAHMDEKTTAILTNADVIAVNQDALGRAGDRIAKMGEGEIWARPLLDGRSAVILLNRSTAAVTMTVNWAQLGLAQDANADVFDLWSKKLSKSVKTRFSAEVQPHGVVMITVQPR